MTKAFLTRRLALGAVLLGHWPWTAALAQTPPANGPTPPTLPLAPMLGKNWQPGLNPADFLVSEKLDGVRALWDGQVLRAVDAALPRRAGLRLVCRPHRSMVSCGWGGAVLTSCRALFAAARRWMPIGKRCAT